MRWLQRRSANVLRPSFLGYELRVDEQQPRLRTALLHTNSINNCNQQQPQATRRRPRTQSSAIFSDRHTSQHHKYTHDGNFRTNTN
jgi:hypothetical protein